MTSKKELQDLQINLKGKLIQVDRFDGQNGPIFENLVVLPAPDEYSSPTRYVVKADHQLAQIDNTVDIVVNVSSRYWRNKNSGKVSHIAELWLAA